MRQGGEVPLTTATCSPLAGGVHWDMPAYFGSFNNKCDTGPALSPVIKRRNSFWTVVSKIVCTVCMGQSVRNQIFIL